MFNFKLLSTKTLCAVGMFVTASQASSNSLASDQLPDQALSPTPSQIAFQAHDGSNVTPSQIKRGERMIADDERSQKSTMSTMSAVEQAQLEAFLINIWNTCKRSNVVVPKTPGLTKLQRVQLYAQAIVDSHNGLVRFVSSFKSDNAAVLDSLQVSDVEKAKLEKGELTNKGLILAKIAEKSKALAEAEAEKEKADNDKVLALKTAAKWKTTTIITSTILTLVAGVLINIMRKHGWEILFG